MTRGFLVNDNVPGCLLVTRGEATQGSGQGRRRVEEGCKENIGQRVQLERVQGSGNEEKELRAKDVWLLIGIKCVSVVLAGDKHQSFLSVLICLKPHQTGQERSLKDMVTPNPHAELPQKQALGPCPSVGSQHHQSGQSWVVILAFT